MDKSNIITCSKTIAGREITLETGKVARQATASVLASSGDTQVLVTSDLLNVPFPEERMLSIAVSSIFNWGLLHYCVNCEL